MEEAFTKNSIKSYLTKYIADIDWDPPLSELWSYTLRQSKGNTALASKMMRRIIGYVVHSASNKDLMIPSDSPYKVLFWCTKWDNFDSQDWEKVFLALYEEDLRITKARRQIASTGIYKSVDHLPLTIQGVNLLYNKALEAKDIESGNKEALQNFKNFIMIYGGLSVSNMFLINKYSSYLNKVISWRSTYFFEKQLHKAYSLEQLINLKKKELSNIDRMYVAYNE